MGNLGNWVYESMNLKQWMTHGPLWTHSQGGAELKRGGVFGHKVFFRGHWEVKGVKRVLTSGGLGWWRGKVGRAKALTGGGRSASSRSILWSRNREIGRGLGAVEDAEARVPFIWRRGGRQSSESRVVAIEVVHYTKSKAESCFGERGHRVVLVGEARRCSTLAERWWRCCGRRRKTMGGGPAGLRNNWSEGYCCGIINEVGH
jgi:hypothetical protein